MLLLRGLIGRLARHEQRYIFQSTLNVISKRWLPQRSSSLPDGAKSDSQSRTLGGCIALIVLVRSTPETGLHEQSFPWLHKSPYAGIDMFRAVVAAMTDDEREMSLQRSWKEFSDVLHVKHTPMVQQEGKFLSLATNIRLG